MTNEIDTQNHTGLIPNFAPVDPEKEKEFNDLSSSNKFLPQLRLFGSSSDAVKEGKVQMGHFALVTGKDQFVHLGDSVNILVISWRSTALDTQNVEQVLSSHDRNSDVFKEIQYRNENEENSGCLCGPEFLVFIPALKRYATLLFGSKSFRREAPVVKGFMSKACTIRAFLASTKKYKWHVPQAVQCSTPFDIPDLEEIKSKVEAFLAPDAEAPVKVGSDRPGSDRR